MPVYTILGMRLPEAASLRKSIHAIGASDFRRLYARLYEEKRKFELSYKTFDPAKYTNDIVRKGTDFQG